MSPALAELRDIHLPAEPGWWPPAPGWWLLLAVGALLLAFLAAWCWRRLAQRRYRRQAVRELAALTGAVPADRQPARINALLKRVALVAYPGTPVAGMHGEDWVRFLAGHAALPAADAAALAALGDDLYRPATAAPPSALAQAAERWIRRHR